MTTAVRSSGSKAAARRPQARGERRRERILAAAEELFAERGFANTSLDAIANAVGIQQPGLLYYFANKRALYEAVVNAAMASLDALTAAALTSRAQPRERLLASTAAWVDAVTARPSVARLLLHEASNPQPETVPPAFSQVGAHVQQMLDAAFAEFGVAPQPDDVFHLMSAVTGSTLFYAAAMQQLMAEPRGREASRSMDRHKTLLLRSVSAVVDEICAGSPAHDPAQPTGPTAPTDPTDAKN
jgi:AcrR family transcriptional regulator